MLVQHRQGAGVAVGDDRLRSIADRDQKAESESDGGGRAQGDARNLARHCAVG